MEMNLRLYIICIATVLALVTPSLADSNYTATVHGGVYESDTFEPLANAMVEVNSTPSQSMVAKIGVYSFELAPGDYSITAKYYQNGTLLYSGGEIVNIKEEGSYVKDLLLFPIYSEALMDSSAINDSESTTNTINNSNSASKTEGSEIDSSIVNFLLIAFVLMILLTGGYQFSRKHKKEEKGTFQESKTGHLAVSSSSPVNIPEISERTQNKSTEPEKWQITQANSEESVSINKPAAELDSRIVITGQAAEPESKISVKEVEGPEPKIPDMASAERKEEYLEQDEELAGPEEDNEIIALEKAEDNLELEIPAQEAEAPAAPKKKLPLPSDLQEVMDIIRGQGGRITQKDLRSKLRYSEGKVSLMLADLERRELIEKFKRGRGNVIIVKDEER